MSRDTADHDRPQISLNQRLHISAKLISNVGAFLIDPLSRNKALLVSDLVYILDSSMALVRVVGLALENDHDTACSLVSCLD